ncbi:hypothetical protein QY049_24465 [Bradyrhizobium sp. WYCCWR 13022]|uniref:hypothetical protein n=1 Tax=unclassified Bradyrhizobium TaxID=2631580 RepID=UPI00263B769D|nr:hypothetical protein [Bradyrhizobium sp. WYCCWR 13022]MDN4986313.1 hypothetical protein [Bradyrhizobium sp. WYCCWR 13022]
MTFVDRATAVVTAGMRLFVVLLEGLDPALQAAGLPSSASDNNEGVGKASRAMDRAALLQRTKELIGRLPDRQVNATTEKRYRRTLANMLREPVLDPLLPGIARGTYYYRRAAMYWASRSVLVRLCSALEAARVRNDDSSARLCAAVLVRLLSRIEPAVEIDPPLEEGAAALKSSPSRWEAANGPHPVPGANSKIHVLGDLPPAWDDTVWQKALETWTDASDQADLDALAVRLLVPVRSEDMMPGERGSGWSEGVLVRRRSAHRIDITIAPAKAHNGKFGTGITVVKINPTKAGGAASYLAERCEGEVLVVSLHSKDGSRKKLLRLGKIALPGCLVNITPYVCRHQIIADLKATLGAGVAVAAACGHCTDRTQAKYGRVQHGRRRRGLIGVASEKVPQAGNVARAAEVRRKIDDAKKATEAALLATGDAATSVLSYPAPVIQNLPADTHAISPGVTRSIPKKQDKTPLARAEHPLMRPIGDGNSNVRPLTLVAPSEPKQIRSNLKSDWHELEFPEPSTPTPAEEIVRRRHAAELWENYVARNFNGLRWNPACDGQVNWTSSPPREDAPP